ncbi:MAG TPA: hypothetical protein VN317_08155 [Candidatus Methanoperedens sp.]|nr:hypothetical protein [Candidatus Methanoperedens sp.]
MVLAAAAVLTVGRLFRGSVACPEATSHPRGWREARHWRKI